MAAHHIRREQRRHGLHKHLQLDWLVDNYAPQLHVRARLIAANHGLNKFRQMMAQHFEGNGAFQQRVNDVILQQLWEQYSRK